MVFETSPEPLRSTNRKEHACHKHSCFQQEAEAQARTCLFRLRHLHAWLAVASLVSHDSLDNDNGSIT